MDEKNPPLTPNAETSLQTPTEAIKRRALSKLSDPEEILLAQRELYKLMCGPLPDTEIDRHVTAYFQERCEEALHVAAFLTGEAT